MLNQENYTIEIAKNKPIQEDYQALKELGISYIQKFSKNVWTDFNAGDPGLTTLELLCYALTDLAYRTQLPLEDLLTEENKATPFTKKNSYKAEEIFVHSPLTIQDYRKLILDRHPEVRNVWFYPINSAVSPSLYIHKSKKELTLNKANSFQQQKVTLSGLYDVKIETIGKPKDIIGEVYKTLQANRNLCEDFHCIDLVKFEYVTICMDVDLDGTVAPDIIKEEVYRQLYLYCAPHLNRYSLSQMLEKGYKVEEIFEGPTLKTGFFDREELADFDKKDVLYISDLINIFLDIPGISNIRKIHLNSYMSKKSDIDLDAPLKKDEEYCLHLADFVRSFRFFVDRKDKKANKINFYYKDLKLHEPGLILESKLIPKKEILPDWEEEWQNVKSKSRNIRPYYSIQNEFPKAFLLGQEGITGLETDERQIQRLQFKGYLLHFEQIMANYLAQLNHVKKLFSWGSDADYRSYMYQTLSPEEIKDLELITSSKYNELFDDITNADNNDDFHDQVLYISSQQNFDRRNRFLNHLIARFNDSFVEFSIVEFFKKNNKTYGKHSIMADKKSFLRTYPYMSANRLKAFDYTLPIWNSTNISGYEMRVAKKLGLTNYITSNPDLVFGHSLVHPVLTLENLADSDLTEFYNYNEENFDRQFGFHIVEHLLLRPRNTMDDLLPICNDNEKDIVNCFCKDPYSFRITVVLPGWLPITLNEGFRAFVERVFREELPAHLAIKFCWIGPKEMLAFEKSYFQFFKGFEKKMLLDCVSKKTLKNEILSQLLANISALDNVYYPSHLVDCEDIDFDFMTNEVSKYPSILGRTKLNSKLTFGVEWIKPIEPVYVGYKELKNIIQYQEIDCTYRFYLSDKLIELDEFNLLSLKKSALIAAKGKITFANNKSIEFYGKGDEMITSIRLQNIETKESDILWLHWDSNQMTININRQFDYVIRIDEVAVSNVQKHMKLINAINEEKYYAIKKVESKPYLSQHELEQLWLERQHDPTFILPQVKVINKSTFFTEFMKAVKTLKLK